MIAKEFIEELKSARQYFDWSYGSSNGKIRGTLRLPQGDVALDPIGAVCYVKTGNLLPENDWIDASEQIGLSLIDSSDLTAAVNNVPTPPQQRGYTKWLRRQIIDTLHLNPEFDPQSGKNPSRFLKLVAGMTRRKEPRSAESCLNTLP